MMLTPLIRRQLVVFTILAVAALAFAGIKYADLPGLVGAGTDEVRVEFADASGLYPSAIVTYRGVKVGEVGDLTLTREHAVATLVLDDDARVPRAAIAELHSTSAIGEQYVDLVPADGDGPYLRDGDTLPAAQSRPMPQIAPVLDKLDRLLASVPTENTRSALSRVNGALGGAGDDVGALVDSTGDLVAEAQQQIGATRSLLDTLQPVLASQQQLAPQTVAYARSLSALTAAVAGSDASLRGLLDHAPSVLRRTDGLVGDLQPTLPDLLAATATDAEVAHTYLPNIEQGLVTYPALMARLQSVLNPRRAEGDAKLDLRAAFDDPQPCITGYEAAAKRRSPSDPTTLNRQASYCALPRPGPEGVRGARNYPCPGEDVRGPSSEVCGFSFRRTTTTPETARPLAWMPWSPTRGQR